jgi:uncharacterized membrane protein
MAKYNHNHTYQEKLLDKARLLVQKTKPIIIPRHKIDKAHAKIRKVMRINKVLFLLVILLSIALAYKFYRGYP